MSTLTQGVASAWRYGAYALPLLLALGATYLIWIGADSGWAALLTVLIALSAAERMSSDDYETKPFTQPRVFVWMMWAFLPVTLLAFLGFLWTLAHGHSGGDLLGLAGLVQATTGFDMLAAHADDGMLTYLLSAVLFSTITGIGSVSIGHELAHRTWEPFSIFAARTCSLFGLFTYYAIEHPHGHHLTVGTPVDSSTALRGENIYRYSLRTTPQDYTTAWAIERDRLARLGLPALHWRNRLLRGWGAELTLMVLITAVSGLLGLFWFLVSVLNAHFTYKLGTYGQHYGIVRVPDSQIRAHHSWDCYNRFTNWFVDGIGRHSQHHLEPLRPFWELEHVPEAPTYAHGYLKTMGFTVIPPLWHRLMNPKLIEWDEQYASPAERALAREANLRSGQPALVAQAARMAVAEDRVPPPGAALA